MSKNVVNFGTFHGLSITKPLSCIQKELNNKKLQQQYGLKKCQFLLFPYSVVPVSQRRHACFMFEEFCKIRLVGEIEPVGYFSNCQVRVNQQPFYFNQLFRFNYTG